MPPSPSAAAVTASRHDASSVTSQRMASVPGPASLAASTSSSSRRASSATSAPRLARPMPMHLPRPVDAPTTTTFMPGTVRRPRHERSPVDDVKAIEQLKARYFRTMDTKDWDGMRKVFADGVVMDTTASGGTVIVGADDFMAFLRETLADVVTVHHGHTPEIELTSPTTATGIWAMED